MSRIIHKFLYVVFSLFILYCAAWYGWGVYVKKILHDTLSSSDRHVVTTEKVELSGFPFSFSYTLKNLSIASKDENDKFTINLGNPVLKSNFSLGSFVMEINNDVNVVTADNKNSYILTYANGSALSVTLKKPIIYSVLSGDLKPLNTRDIAEFKYLDAGYSIKDSILEKIILTSSANNINVNVSSDDISDSVLIKANLVADGSADFYAQGSLSLVADLNVKGIFDENKPNRQINGMVFDFSRLSFQAQDYSLEVLGNLSVMGSTSDSSGVVTLKLNNVPKFIDTVGHFYSAKQADYLKGLIFKMSGVAVGQPLDNADIEIKGENKDIKFGHATMVDLILYSLRK